MPFDEWTHVPSGLWCGYDGHACYADRATYGQGDLYRPGKPGPQGIRKLLWDEVGDDAFTFPAGKDRFLVSYETSDEHVAYIEPIAVGDVLPDMPLFLASRSHVQVPLESTYQATWDATAASFAGPSKRALPDPDSGWAGMAWRSLANDPCSCLGLVREVSV